MLMLYSLTWGIKQLIDWSREKLSIEPNRDDGAQTVKIKVILSAAMASFYRLDTSHGSL